MCSIRIAPESPLYPLHVLSAYKPMPPYKLNVIPFLKFLIFQLIGTISPHCRCRITPDLFSCMELVWNSQRIPCHNSHNSIQRLKNGTSKSQCLCGSEIPRVYNTKTEVFMPDNFFLIGQVIHDLEQDCDYRLLWTSSTPDLPSYWLRLPAVPTFRRKSHLRQLLCPGYLASCTER